jgi:hypothetical protein
LIRDCYGSEAVALQGGESVSALDIIGDADTLEALADAVEKADNAEYEYAERQVMEILGQQQTESVRQAATSRTGGMSVVDLETSDFVGQAVRSNGSIVDMTLLRRDAAERGFRMRKRR